MTATAAQAATAPSESFSPSATGWIARMGVLAAVLGAVVFLTATLSGLWAFHIANAAIFAIIGLSLNIVLGYVGQVSLGHHGFVGISAFVAAYYVTDKAGCVAEDCAFTSFVTATIFAIAAGAISAGVLGIVALRIKGLYLALITLAYGFMAESAIFEIPWLTGAGAGKPAPRPDGFVGDKAFAFLCLGLLALVIFVDWRLIRSKVGRAILSIKNSEPVAASYGINVTGYKVLAFTVSGAFAGLAGSLLAFRIQNVVANDFIFANSLLWVLMVVVGGLGNRTGVVIGSAFFALFPELLNLAIGGKETLFDRPPDYYRLVIGPLLALITIIQFPGGIAEQISPITRWLRGQRFSMHPDGHTKHDRKSLAARLGLEKRKDGDPALAAIEQAVTDARGSAPPTSGNGSSSAPAPTEPQPTEQGDKAGAPGSIEAPDVWGNLMGKGR